GNLSISGTSAINASSIATTGTQIYTGAVTIGNANTSLSSSGTTFSSTVNALTSGADALTLSGPVTFNGVVGATKLASLTSSGATTINTTAISTTGAQNYNGSLTLSSASANLTASTVTFGSALSASANALTVTGNAIFDAAVDTLKSLLVTGTTNFVGPTTVTTSGAQTYTGTLTLNGNTTLTSTGTNYALGFGSIVGNTYNLTLSNSGAVNFGGAVIGSGGTLWFTPNLSTVALDVNSNAVSGVQTISLTSLGKIGNGWGLVEFGRNDMTAGLTLNAYSSWANNTEFATKSGLITVAGAQNFGANNATFITDTTPTISANLTGTGTLWIEPQSSTTNIAVASPTVVANALNINSTTLSHFLSWSQLNIGSSSLSNGTITISPYALWSTPTTFISPYKIVIAGNQTSSKTLTYNGPTVLSGTPITITSTGTTFDSTLDGSSALTLAGHTTFNGNVGGIAALASLTAGAVNIGIPNLSIDATGNKTFNGAINAIASGDTLTVGGGGENFVNAGIGTTSPLLSTLTFIDAVSLGSNIATSGDVNFNNQVTLATNATINSGTGTTTFGSTVNGSGSGGQNLTLTGTGNTIFDNAVGGNKVLGSLSVAGNSSIANNITTTGGQTYTGSVELTGDSTIASSGTTFSSTIDGAHNLTLSSATTFNGDVGDTTPLASLTTQAITLNAGAANITTSGDQIYNGLVYIPSLPAARTFDSTSGNLKFLSGITANNNPLVFESPNNDIYLGGNVYSTAALDFANALILENDTTISSGTASTTFGSTIDSISGANRSLTVNSTGMTYFDGLVGSNQALNNLTIAGSATINTAAINSTGIQTYNGAVSLGSNSNLTGSGIIFNSTVDSVNGNQSLTSNGATTFGGVVGGNQALSSLTVNGTTAIDTTGITTSGLQNYSGAVTLGNNATLTASGLTFGSSVDGTQSLTLSGPATFNGNIGSSAALVSLTTDAATFNPGAANVTTTHDQNYNGGVILGTNVTFNSGAYTTNFNSTVNSAAGNNFSLTANNLSLYGTIGGNNKLGTITANGTTNLGTTVNTTSNQTYNGAVTLAGNSALNSTSGNIEFGSTVDGNNNLVIDTTGNVSFLGQIGSVIRLATLDIMNAFNVTASQTTDVSTLQQEAGSGTTHFSNANATGNISLTSNGITGAYLGVYGSLNSQTGKIVSKVSFNKLNIAGAGATLTGGYIGAPGAGSQTMANLIKVFGVALPNTNYTFDGFEIGYQPQTSLPPSLNSLPRFQLGTEDFISQFDKPLTQEEFSGCASGLNFSEKCESKQVDLQSQH
ncbi:MAG: beta strand repeat-containing protein, partial [Rickettsiales bacterium]